MIVQQLEKQSPFTTKDGSTIRSILDRTNAPVEKQSLAEASMSPGQTTDRHYHTNSEELYFLLEGTARMEIGDEASDVGPGDAILIPAGSLHRITATTKLRFLCCCAPPYDHTDTYLA
jgi:mannose-6-phosphate isomerase-like protein (cupin superfamily)